jgi:hypothetical protein
MAGGYRVTETDDFRITEDGDSRITEEFLDGFADLQGTSTLSVVPKLTTRASANLSSTGSTLLAGELTAFGRSALNGVGSTAVDGDLKASGAHAGVATGTVSSSGVRIQPGATSLSGTGSIASVAGFKFVGASDIQAEGIFSAAPHYIAQGLFGPFVEDPVRETEADDVRITEDGDTRIASNVSENSGVGSIVVSPTYIAFDSTVYCNVSSSWKVAIPYVKVDNEWVVPEKTYRHMNGGWKRIN